MKFKNIKVGMKVQHKESGDVFDVVRNNHVFVTLNKPYFDADGYDGVLLFIDDAKLFKKYKEPQS